MNTLVGKLMAQKDSPAVTEEELRDTFGNAPTMLEFEEAYQVNYKKELGRGAFSKVYECTRKMDGLTYAAKVVKFNNQKTLAKDMAALKVEAKICGLVSHPHVVGFYNMFISPEQAVLVFEEVSGGELFDEIVARTHYSEKDASDCIAQILDAVKLVHAKGIIHRDIKPENLLLTKSKKTKLTDFGLAILTKETKFHGFCGTPSYMAPELVERKPYNTPIDVWACGVVLYILLVGYQPFWADTTKNNDELYKVICSGELDFPSEDWDTVSPRALDLVKRMLGADPNKRITVQQCLEHEFISGTTHNTLNRTATIANLRKFNAKRKLKGAMRAVRTGMSLFSLARAGSIRKTLSAASVEAASQNAKEQTDMIAELKQSPSKNLPGLPIEMVLQANRMLINSITTRNWTVYKELVSKTMTCFEPEAEGVLVEGLEFHRFFFDIPLAKTTPAPNTTLLNEKCKMLGQSAALVTYVRVVQSMVNGAPQIKKSVESRVWQKVDGKWVNIHFHRTGCKTI